MHESPWFIFQATGTRGDLLPALALARELLGRGYACEFWGNDSVQRTAQEWGVPFSAVAPAQTNNLGGIEENFGKYVFPAYGPTLELIERRRRAASQLVIVNNRSYAATTLACERYRLPLCRLVLTPFQMSSLVDPPWPWKPRVAGPLARAFRKYTLPAIYAASDSHPFIISRLNAHRHAAGLDSLHSLEQLERLVQHQICWFPSWYCPPAADWPGNLDQVGFPLPSGSARPPEALQRFVERHGKPIVFTPGTGVTDVAEFFRHARAACAQLALPGLFLSPRFCETSASAADPPCLHLDYIDLELALRHALLLVHHGGIGTMARALQAGVPQIICPRAFDQPDNAQRVALLGVGATLDHRQLSGEALARVCQRLLSDPETRRRAREISARIQTDDAIARAADILVQRFARAPGKHTARADVTSA